jgi:hypothetical protein
MENDVVWRVLIGRSEEKKLIKIVGFLNLAFSRRLFKDLYFISGL